MTTSNNTDAYTTIFVLKKMRFKVVSKSNYLKFN